MIEIISDFFIRRHGFDSSAAVRRVYGIVCSLSGVLLNLLMFVFKLSASVFSGSVAAAVDAIHNLTDSASSVVTLLSFILSGQKKTRKYPMGKGRIEYVAGFVVAVVLLSAGIELAKASITKIITPEPVTFSLFSVIMLLISFLTKLYMAFFNRRISRKISSSALRAASVDCLCDSFATLIAAFAVISVRFTALNVDAWGGLAVSLFILYAGIRAAKDTVKMLVGMPLDDEMYNRMAGLIRQTAPQAELEGMMLHDYGPGNRVLCVKAVLPVNTDMNEFFKMQDILSEKVRSLAGWELAMTVCPDNKNDPPV